MLEQYVNTVWNKSRQASSLEMSTMMLFWKYSYFNEETSGGVGFTHKIKNLHSLIKGCKKKNR